MYERESEFFDMVESRAEDMDEEWVKTLDCPIMRVDGTKPVEENINLTWRRIYGRKPEY